MAIHFHFEDINETFKPKEYEPWIELCLKSLEQKDFDITYIFCSDAYIQALNKQSLNHDYATDIITFDNRLNSDDPIFTDLFIGVETVMRNAQELGQSFEDELKRVMIHGVLHLCGFNDKTEEEQREMRKKEDEMLSVFT